MTEGLRTQTPGLVADDVRLPSQSLAGVFGKDVLLAQTFVVLWHVCASGDPGRIFGVFLWFTFASASGVSTYALGFILGVVFIFWAGLGVTLGVPLMPRFRRWVGFGCFFCYVLRLLSSILRAYYVVGRSHSGHCLPGFVFNPVGWLLVFVVIRAFVTCVVVFFWPCHADWVDA